MNCPWSRQPTPRGRRPATDIRGDAARTPALVKVVHESTHSRTQSRAQLQLGKIR